MEVWPVPNSGHDRGGPWLPPGFRFHPTDEELVIYYLAKKIQNPAFTDRAISEVDLNKCEPWDLPGRAKMGEKEWYFYSLRDRKYPTGMRTNRATDAGYWKATGKDREVMSSRSACLVGMKKTLVFYKGRAPKGEKTNWVMHEYRMEGNNSFLHLPKSSKDEWAVCRIFQKSVGGKKIPFDIRRSYLDDLSSSLPPLLESPHLLTHEDALQEREAAPNISFNNPAAYNQGFRAFNRTGDCLRYGGAGELSDLAGLSKYSPYFYNNDQSVCKSQVSGSVCLDITHQPSVAEHAAMPTANVCSTVALTTPSVNMPSNAILKALVEHYANTGDANAKHTCKAEPYISAEVASKFHSRLPESLPLHADQLCYDVSTQQQLLQNLQGVGNLPQQAALSDICGEQPPGVPNRLGRFPSDPSSSVDLESLWGY